MPRPVITIAQMREWENATWASGQTEAEVIRRVGGCVAQHALGLSLPGDQILILAGKGNNGADAQSARAKLADRRVELLLVADPARDLGKLDALLSSRPALVIDGLFGIGINRPLSPEWATFIDRVNEARLRVLAVDVPSGLDADTGQPHGAAIRASVTLTVGAPKVGLVQETASPFVGKLEIADHVGLVPCPCESELQWTLSYDFAGFPPARPVGTHKGSYGHAALIAGSLGYHGAAVLAARAAQRAKPGLVTLYTMDAVYIPAASQLQAVMVSAWNEDNDLPGKASAVLMGPGLAAPDVPEQLKSSARELWLGSPLPIVADASALDWLPPRAVAGGTLRVITPHPGEAARLLGTTPQRVQGNRFQALRALSSRFGNSWVVLKGHQTLVGRNTGAIFVNPTGNPYLAQGGSGDVLAGFLVGLLAQPALRAEPLTTLRYAVWEHGAAADHLQNTRQNWVVEDLVRELGNQH
jgi:ADP-dependent NAD(P)H-hydrate dehydratase / NAD(P)H-hydrate epimerase